MDSLLEPRNRIVIPRWRNFERGAGNNEIIVIKPNEVNQSIDAAVLQHKVEDWNRRRDISNALELVNASYSLGELDVAVDAARFLLEKKPLVPNALGLILNQIVGVEKREGDLFTQEFNFESFFKASGIQIHKTRSELKANPNNPLLWTILARNYSVVGNKDKAKKAIDIALGLTRHSNTYVQRIASRFYYHLGEVDRALYLIRKSKDYEQDPWLISTDIAYSTKLGRYNKNLILGTRMIESDHFANKDLTELASSVGTVQLYSGSLKQARKSFSVSLMDPNENSLAQIEYASSITPIFEEKRFFNYFESLGNAYEARAHEFVTSGNLLKAYENGCQWLLDQPFSKRPAIFTQHLAITKLDKFDQGIEIGKFALHSNPNSFELHNNVAFAYAKKGEIASAIIYLKKMRSLASTPYFKIFLLATEGLIRMREGKTEEGKILYEKAILLSTTENQLHLRDLAITNYIMESVHATGDFDSLYYEFINKNLLIKTEIEELRKKYKER